MAYKYSAYGSHWMGGLRVYHQGGLDCYCGFYAIANLINFLYLKKDLSYLRNNPDFERDGDFLGANKFEAFNGLIGAGTLNGFFPKGPFGGGEGLDAPRLKDALSQALSYFKINAQVTIEEDESIYVGDPEQYKCWFRIGAEKPFVNSADNALGVACVIEDEVDEITHCVVLVGKNHLQNEMDIPPLPGRDWNGIVLDSDRGYKFWKYDARDGCLHIQIQGNKKVEDKPMYWVYSFISVRVK
ncbi:MAG: hypothetical protein ACREC9_02700 [Methylocella sp.]